ICLATLGRTDEAYEAFLRAQEQNPRDALVQSNLGVLEFNRKRFDAAREHFERAVALDPNLVKPHLGLAKLAEVSNDPVTARHHCDIAVRLAPQSPDVRPCLDVQFR